MNIIFRIVANAHIGIETVMIEIDMQSHLIFFVRNYFLLLLQQTLCFRTVLANKLLSLSVLWFCFVIANDK